MRLRSPQGKQVVEWSIPLISRLFGQRWFCTGTRTTRARGQSCAQIPSPLARTDARCACTHTPTGRTHARTSTQSHHRRMAASIRSWIRLSSASHPRCFYRAALVPASSHSPIMMVSTPRWSSLPWQLCLGRSSGPHLTLPYKLSHFFTRSSLSFLFPAQAFVTLMLISTCLAVLLHS